MKYTYILYKTKLYGLVIVAVNHSFTISARKVGVHRIVHEEAKKHENFDQDCNKVGLIHWPSLLIYSLHY